MEWRDEGIVLGIRRLGETSVIAEVLTRAHGRHMGLVRGGRSKRMQPMLQPGNGVDIVWRARIEDQLGTFALEATAMRAATFIASPQALHGIALVGALARLVPERDPLYRRCAHFIIETGRPSVPTLVNMILMQLELAGVVDPAQVPSSVTPPRPYTGGHE